MDFNTALKELNSGNAIRRPNMICYYLYIFWNCDSNLGYSKSIVKSGGNLENYSFTEEDRQSTDWELVDEELWKLL